MGSRTWLKLYASDWIEGSLREETPELRGIWADVLCLAAHLPYGDIFEIKLTDNVGIPDEQIAEILSIPLDTWLDAKERLILTDRIEVKPGNIICIVNWQKYQNEYHRQRQYRKRQEEDNL